jgi:hypothetical protein
MNHKCPHCPSEFKTLQGVRLHTTLTRKLPPSKEELRKRSREAAKKYYLRKSHSKDAEEYTIKCTICNFRCASQGGLTRHQTVSHPGHIFVNQHVPVGFKSKKMSKEKLASMYDETTIKWLNDTSNRNVMRMCKGNVKKLTAGQIMVLKHFGILIGREIISTIHRER